jgi:dissimilatory sulfite reductase (desulfoviridin) alpha/beta subunit
MVRSDRGGLCDHKTGMASKGADTKFVVRVQAVPDERSSPNQLRLCQIIENLGTNCFKDDCGLAGGL